MWRLVYNVGQYPHKGQWLIGHVFPDHTCKSVFSIFSAGHWFDVICCIIVNTIALLTEKL